MISAMIVKAKVPIYPKYIKYSLLAMPNHRSFIVKPKSDEVVYVIGNMERNTRFNGVSFDFLVT